MGILEWIVLPWWRPKDPEPYETVKARAKNLGDGANPVLQTFDFSDELPENNIVALRHCRADAAARLAVYAHGNMQDVVQTWHLMHEGQPARTFFENLNTSEMWFWEYAGYGARVREFASEAAIRKDAEIVGQRALLTAQRLGMNEVVFVGWSLGSYAATVSALAFQKAAQMCEEGAKVPTAKVVLVSPLASALHARIEKGGVRALLGGLNQFSTVDYFRRLTCPRLLVHGGLDDVVFPYNSDVLEESAEEFREANATNPSKVTKVIIAGGGHSGLMSDRVSCRAVAEFIEAPQSARAS